MLERVNARVLPVVNRAAEQGPMVGVCCSVCRTCTTMNIVALALGAVAALGAAVARTLNRRLVRSA